MSDNYIYPKIDRLRRKLLDLGRANPLINPRLTAKSKKVFRLVNDQAQLILRCLANQCHLRFKALPPLDLIPPEETTEAFQKAMTLARLTDSDYLASLVKLNDLEPAQASLEEEKLERALKDRVRDSLGLKPSAPQKTPTCQEHAEKHGLNPDYDLPATTLKTLPKPKDRDIQTLFWPEEFDRKLKGLMDECRRMEEETGVNSLKVIFGFLDWIDENHESYFSPLTMTQARLEKKSGRRGLEYLIYADDDDCEVNFVLAEKLRLERGLELPELTLGEDGTPDLELFFQEISEIAPPNIKWRVRRQVAVGVFPSSGMNMYEDLAEDKHDFERLPLIKKFFGGFASGPEMFAADYNLEDNLADNQLSDLVLDADVSQSSTLIDLRAGRDLAVEGPPGSGKSQTIVNAIAGALFENKTVLFVAEKMAALEVVKSRLEAIGLGEFLLPLQVQRSTRQQVIQSIRTRCFMSPPKLNSDLAPAPRGYRENRDILKDYVKFIGQVFGQTELTFYDLVGWALNRLAILDKAPDAFKKPPVMEGAPNWSKADLAEIVSAAKDTAKAYQEADASPWRHLELVSQVSHFEVEEILKLAEKAAEALTITEGWRRDLSFGLGEKPASELIKLESFWRAFSQLSAGLNQNFLVWVLEDKNYPVARYYYERIATYRQNAQSLTASLVGASPKEANDLATLLALGQKENLKTFDLKVLEAEIIAEETRLATLAQLLASQKKSGAWLKIVGFSSLEASDPVVLRQKIASAATELERLTALIERFMAQRKALAFLGLNSLDQVELKTLAADLAVAEKELENLHSLLERYAALDQILQRRSLSWAELEPASLKITLAKTTEELERRKAFTAGWLAIVEGDPNLGFSLGKLDWRAEEGLLIEESEELNKRQFLLERYNLLTQKYPLLALGATNRLVQAGEVSQLGQNQTDLADIKAIETSYATLIQRFPRFLAVLPNASALTSQEEFPQARERLKALVERFAALSQGYPGLDLANQPDINPVYVAENLDEKKKAAEDLKRLVERKNRLDKILSQFGLTSWANADWGVLAKRLAEDEAEIQRVRPLVDSYQAISPFWPELDKIPFRRLRQARELLAKTDKKLFALAQAKGLIQEPVLLKAKNAAGLDLFQRQQTLSRLVDLNNPLSPAELRELASTLWRAGTFKFLSLAYRKARSVYNSLSLVGPLTDAKAGAEILNRLMAFKEDLLTFARDPKVKELYGAYFAGLKTDFGLFNEALKFRDNLEAIFPGSAFEGFKNWLQAGRPEALNLLNAADYPDNNEDFTSFMAWFERLKARVADQKELAQNLKDPEFQAWLTEFPQHLARLRRLEDDIEGAQALLAFIEGFEPRQAASDYAALQSHIKNLSAQMAERTALIEDLKESDLLEINLEPPNDAQSTLKLAATVKARKELLDLGRAFSPEPSIIEYPAVLERENQLEAQAYDLGEVLAFFEARAEASSQDWAALTEKSNFLQDKTKALSQLLALVEDPGFAEFSGQLSQVEAQKSLITERHKAGEELANLLQAADFKVTKKDWRDRQSQWQNLKTEISQKKSACSSFEPMLAIFKSAVDLSYENVTNLAQELKFNQDFDLWLNSDPGLKNVPDNYLTLTSSDDPLATLKCLDFLKDQTAYWPLTRSILEKSSILSFSQELSGFLASRVQAYLDLARLTERTGLLLEIDEKNYLLAASFLREAASDRPGFLAQRALVNQKNRLGQLGFDWALEALKATGLGQIGLFVEASLSRILYRELYKRNSHKFDQYFGKTLGNARASFAENDRLAIKGSRERLRSLLAKPLSQFPVGLAKGPVSGYTEMGLLSHEMGKKTRYVSIRELTKRAGQTLKGLKPCWMMSPLAVATYLTPGQMIFDLCIIDEASQMTPENALGAMARSRQIMVVGDTNQLPPTNFFKKRLAELDDEEDETGLVEESILEAANKIFSPSRRLRWHYRSRHSSLIQFSNQWVYNNELMVFPSPDNQAMGVSLVKVDGLYKTGVNPIEAEAMVKAALKFMADFPDLSLGLVTLNIKQMELIRVKMDFELAQNAKARAYIARWSSRNEGLESFFIKNLESVQGDERDAIFIGTVYGPEKLGGPTANRFGPINGLAGKRRLNVLFTRSKRRIVTFSSMSPGDITLSESNEGATMLKNWLIYSQSQMDSTVRSTEKVSDPGFLGLLARVLEEAGCEVEPGVGLTQKIDLGVRHPKWGRGYILGLETDGPNWRETKSPRDRDRLKDEVLTGLGWKLYRAWSLNWLNTPQFEAESLTKAVQERLKELKRENPAGWVEPSITPPKAPLDLKALKRP